MEILFQYLTQLPLSETKHLPLSLETRMFLETYGIMDYRDFKNIPSSWIDFYLMSSFYIDELLGSKYLFIGRTNRYTQRTGLIAVKVDTEEVFMISYVREEKPSVVFRASNLPVYILNFMELKIFYWKVIYPTYELNNFKSFTPNQVQQILMLFSQLEERVKERDIYTFDKTKEIYHNFLTSSGVLDLD